MPKLHLNAKFKLVFHNPLQPKKKKHGKCIILIGERWQKFTEMSQSTQLTGCQKVTNELNFQLVYIFFRQSDSLDFWPLMSVIMGTKNIWIEPSVSTINQVNHAQLGGYL